MVENEEIATRIVKYLLAEKGGRVTFMPLSKIHAADTKYPEEFGSDVVPMIKRLKFNPKFKPAFNQVGDCVMKDLKVASTLQMSASDIMTVYKRY